MTDSNLNSYNLHYTSLHILDSNRNPPSSMRYLYVPAHEEGEIRGNFNPHFPSDSVDSSEDEDEQADAPEIPDE
jgi:hypothetical protein